MFTLETLDKTLEDYLKENLPEAKVVVAKCISNCGECSASYVVLKAGKSVRATSREALLEALKA
jgi:uncharacterized protein YuzB (UPF0349 family)